MAKITCRLSARVLVAPDAEHVIQQTGGHADLPVWSLIDTTPSGIRVSTFFNSGARSRMNLNSSVLRRIPKR